MLHMQKKVLAKRRYASIWVKTKKAIFLCLSIVQVLESSGEQRKSVNINIPIFMPFGCYFLLLHIFTVSRGCSQEQKSNHLKVQKTASILLYISLIEFLLQKYKSFG